MFIWEKPNSRSWQATPSEKGHCDACTSTDLFSCAWLRMSSSLSSCTTSDLQANSEEEGERGVEGKTGGGWGRDNKPAQFTSLFKLNWVPFTTLALPAHLGLTGAHLPFWSSPEAPYSESKEVTNTMRHSAIHSHSPFSGHNRRHACFHYLSSSSSSLLFTVWALLSLVIFCRR